MFILTYRFLSVSKHWQTFSYCIDLVFFVILNTFFSFKNNPLILYCTYLLTSIDIELRHCFSFRTLKHFLVLYRNRFHCNIEKFVFLLKNNFLILYYTYLLISFYTNAFSVLKMTIQYCIKPLLFLILHYHFASVLKMTDEYCIELLLILILNYYFVSFLKITIQDCI